MEFIKAIVEKVNSKGAPIVQQKQFEALIPLSKAEVIFENPAGNFEILFPEKFLCEYNIKIITIQTDLNDLFKVANKIDRQMIY